jgi:hypothetical protein
MARVTVSIECEAEEFRSTLESLLGARDLHALAAESAGDEAAQESTAGEKWNREELMQLWSGSRPEARALLAEIAKHPDGYTFEDLQSTFQLDGLTVGGQLSSVGHAKRRLFPTKPDPVQRDYRMRRYTMDPEVAKVFRELGD